MKSEGAIYMNKKSTIARINILKRTGNFFNNLKMCINTHSDEELLSLLNFLMNNSYPISRDSFFPKSYNDTLIYKATGTSTNLIKLMHWCVNIQNYFKDDIANFLKHKQSFDFYVLSGDYDAAENTLAEIEQTICFSYWSLKNRMLIANLKNYDIEEYINNLSIEDNKKAYAYLFAQFTSEACDTGVYQKNIKHIMSTLKSESFASCFKYLYTSTGSYTEKDFIAILEHCNAYSIIDSYLAIKFVAHCIEISNQDNKSIKNVLQTLSTSIIDDELTTLITLSTKAPISCTDKCNLLLKHFLQQDFEYILTNKSNHIKTLNDCSLAKINIYSVALALCENTEVEFLNENSMIDKIILLISELLLCKSDFSFRNGIQKLNNYARILKWFDISNPIACFVANLKGEKPNRNSIIAKSYCIDDLFLYKEFAEHRVTPLFFESLIYYQENNFDYTDIVHEFSNTTNRLQTISLLYILYYQALEKKDFKYALEIFCKSVSKYQGLVYRYEPSQLYSFVYDNITIHEQNTIGEVIFCFLVEQLKDFRTTTFKNFLDENRIMKPLEIISHKLDKDIMFYFLRELCSIKNMSTLYLAFNNSVDVENHRIEICKFLLENDKQNKNLYSNEISNIVKEQEARKLKATIDSSKLSIDYSYIREKLFDEFTELQKKYYATRPNASEIVGYDSVVATSNQYVKWHFYANSREVILENMFKKYSSEFCFGIKGLDTFLSTRVRHGTFQNTINKVFVQNNLSNTDNNFFKPMFSKGWISEDVTSIVKNFNAELNDLILELTNTKFKVYIENFINGAIFDYNITIEDIAIISISILKSHHQLTVIDFIDIIENCIVRKTNNYLAEIRNITLEKLKNDILCLLERFSSDIKPYCVSNNGLSKINDKIVSCQTDVQNRIDEIKNWFYLTESEPMGNFSFDELISVLNKTLQQQFDDFGKINFEIINNVTSDFTGETFVYLYDVLQILFSNAIIHSKHDNLEDLNISLTLEKSTLDKVCLSLQNNYSINVDKNRVDKSVEKINTIYKMKEYKNVDTHREGGMGQIKVLDILFNILGIGLDFVVSCTDSLYKVQITMTERGVIAIEQDNISG